MYDHAKEYEIQYHDEPPYEVLRTKWLTFEEVLLIKKVEEMLEVYYNSGQFEVTMKLLYALSESSFQLFLQLGDFYEQKGYAGMQHSRLRRCEILLEFLREAMNLSKEDVEVFEEALTFDLYYRENCKTRPSWAVDPTSFKDLTKRFCDKGKQSHLEPFHFEFPTKREVGLKELPVRLSEPSWVLFHYDERNPLDHQARVERIDTRS